MYTVTIPSTRTQVEQILRNPNAYVAETRKASRTRAGKVQRHLLVRARSGAAKASKRSRRAG